MATRMALISGTTNYQDIEDKDLVIEAVFENMDLKKKIFAEIDRSVNQTRYWPLILQPSM